MYLVVGQCGTEIFVVLIADLVVCQVTYDECLYEEAKMLVEERKRQ
jgi:hypothetical protein